MTETQHDAKVAELDAASESLERAAIRLQRCIRLVAEACDEIGRLAAARGIDPAAQPDEEATDV